MIKQQAVINSNVGNSFSKCTQTAAVTAMKGVVDSLNGASLCVRRNLLSVYVFSSVNTSGVWTLLGRHSASALQTLRVHAAAFVFTFNYPESAPFVPTHVVKTRRGEHRYACGAPHSNAPVTENEKL